MERVVRLLAVLHEAGADGVDAERLVAVGEYGDQDPHSQLARDLRQLRQQGWRIDNVAGSGVGARYRLASGDNRLRLRLTPAQQAALHRAALLADRGELVQRLGLEDDARPTAVATIQPGPEVPGQDGQLTLIVDAVSRARLLRFRYKGSDRVVHPGSVRHQNHQWYLTGIEDGDQRGTLKHFVVGRISELTADPPDTAHSIQIEDLELQPLRWRMDEPMTVVLSTTREFVPDVQRWLQEPEESREEGPRVLLTYMVTNRSALRSRIYLLGRRVEVVSPDSLREEILDELAEMAGL